MGTSGGPRTGGGSGAPSTPVTPIHRLEGGVIAAGTVTVFVLAGFDWWWPLALFVVFDFSMLGYALGNRVGALTYNVVHNYAAPVLLATSYVVLAAMERAVPALAIIAASWLFHVGADRALGFGPRPSRPASSAASGPR